MNCDRVQDLLSEAIDGALAPPESEGFHAHLAGCVACRATLSELRESLALLNELPAVEPREGFDDAVWTLIRAERRVRDGGLRVRLARAIEELGSAGGWLRWAPLGAAAGLLAWVAMSPVTPHGGTPVVAEADTDASATEFAAQGTVETVDPRFRAVEYSGNAPEPIERYLESRASEARDLSFPAETYRRSNWHYPMTPVVDPVNVVPVTGPAINEFEATSRVAESSPGVPVLSF